MATLTLLKAIKKKSLSKRQLAKRMGKRYENVFRMFRPSYNPRFSQLVEIAAAIGCQVRDLFEE